jgi:DNA-directed RNA polymerase subunit alpha
MMTEEVNIPKIQIEERAVNRAVFVIEPFYPGFGTTVGNALRRVLLSVLPGAAVIGVKIAGVDHEFTPISGVREDAVNVVLNLKKLRFHLAQPGLVTLKLKANKPGTVTGADIELPAGVELINPEIEIATVADKGSLDMDIQVAKGRGYLTAEQIDGKGFAIGTIAVDASFTPVTSVSFKVEPTRVGEMINYDKLTLDVTTDGSITPEDAVKLSSMILIRQLEVFGNDVEDLTLLEESSAEEVADTKDFNVDEINLSIRTTNALVNNGLRKISDIVAVGSEKLGEMKGLGAKALDEITVKLEELGIPFPSKE